MMQKLFTYLLSVAAAGLFGAVIRTLAPEKNAGRVVRLSCGLLILLLTVSPLLKIEADDISEWLSRIEMSREAALSGIEVRTKDLTAKLISERVEAYVLDKAEALGMMIEVEVSMQSGSYPIPEEIRIRGSLTEEQKRILEQLLEQQLAIPPDRQVYEP